MRRLSLLSLAVTVTGCGGGDPLPAPHPVDRTSIALSASPSHASMFGLVDVSLDGDFSAL